MKEELKKKVRIITMEWQDHLQDNLTLINKI